MYNDETIKREADMFIKRATNLKEVADELGIAKSTLHIHLTKILRHVDPKRYFKVREIIYRNIEIRNKRFCRK